MPCTLQPRFSSTMMKPGLHHDYAQWLNSWRLFDASPTRYHHNRTGEDNADAHMKRQIMGREVVVAVTKGKLDFGPWEQIFYGEFDGRQAQTGAGQGHRRLTPSARKNGLPARAAKLGRFVIEFAARQ